MKTIDLRLLLCILFVFTAAFMFGCDRTPDKLVPVMTDTSTDNHIESRYPSTPKLLSKFYQRC